MYRYLMHTCTQTSVTFGKGVKNFIPPAAKMVPPPQALAQLPLDLYSLFRNLHLILLNSLNLFCE